MVQLKDGMQIRIAQSSLSFNSNMVQLKVDGLLHQKLVLGFNSNMVQLKVDIEPDTCVITSMFQFQYGTIKRVEQFFLSENFIMFQFQYGTIKSPLSYRVFPYPIVFQFQYGTIKSRYF